MKNLLIFLLGFLISISIGLHSANATGYSCEEMDWYDHSGQTCNVVFDNSPTGSYSPSRPAGNWEFGQYGNAYWNGNSVRLRFDPWAVDCDSVEVRRSCSEIRADIVAFTAYPSDDPQEPATCSNGIMDSGETGIDCGGECSSVCVVGCPSGTQSYPIAGSDGSMCANRIDLDASGSCPVGFYKEGDYCIEFSSVDWTPALASEEFWLANPIPAADPPETEINETTGTFTTVSTSSSTDPDGTIRDSEIVSTTTTDPDGSEEVKVSTTDTVTNPDGSTSITTSINITGSTTGGDGSATSAYGSSFTSTSNYDSDGNLTGTSESSSDYESEEGASPGSIINKTPAAINFQPILDLKNDLSGRFPISLVSTVSDVLGEFNSSPAAPCWNLQFPNPWGGSIPFSIDLAPMAQLATIVRTFLQYFLLICGFFLLYKRWT